MQTEQPLFELGRITSRRFRTPEARLLWHCFFANSPIPSERDGGSYFGDSFAGIPAAMLATLTPNS